MRRPGTDSAGVNLPTSVARKSPPIRIGFPGYVRLMHLILRFLFAPVWYRHCLYCSPMNVSILAPSEVPSGAGRFSLAEAEAETSPRPHRETASIENRRLKAETEYLTDCEREELEQKIGHPLPGDLKRHSPLVYSFLLERKVERAQPLSREEIRTYHLAAKGLVRLSDEEIQQRLSGSLAASSRTLTFDPVQLAYFSSTVNAKTAVPTKPIIPATTNGTSGATFQSKPPTAAAGVIERLRTR